MAAGQLLIIATPIGNLDDLSPRAAESLRRARQLLTHLGIEGARLERLDAEVEARGVERWVEALEQGATLAMVSDAGTPVVSDPGAALVRAAGERGVVVTPIPGPSAVMAALAASGFSGERFRFMGFVPRSGRGRREALASMKSCAETLILFEAPKRIARSLAELAQLMPDREAVGARELTKVHEELWRGSLTDLAERAATRAWRGEMTVVLGPAEVEIVKLSPAQLDERIDALLSEGLRAKQAAQALALDSGWSARDVYARISVRNKARDE